MDYVVAPLFWGPTFPSVPENTSTTPFTPQQFVDSLNVVVGSGYFSHLDQYGIGKVIIAQPTTVNDPWPTPPDGTYVTKFKVDDVAQFLKRRLATWPEVFVEVDIPGGGVPIKPIHLIVLPNGSVFWDGSIVNNHDNGYHYTSLGSDQIIWAWIYGSANLNGAILYATHEIVEALGKDGTAPKDKELCDDCAKTERNGVPTVNGLTVATYFDLKRNKCVAPGAIDTSVDAFRDHLERTRLSP
jgi:hypothetical protein